MTSWVWDSLVDLGPPLSQAAFQKLIQIWVAKNSLGPPARPTGAGKRSAGDKWANQMPSTAPPLWPEKSNCRRNLKDKKLTHWLKQKKTEATLPSKPEMKLFIAIHQGACRIQPARRGLWFYTSGVNTSTPSWRLGLNWAPAGELDQGVFTLLRFQVTRAVFTVKRGPPCPVRATGGKSRLRILEKPPGWLQCCQGRTTWPHTIPSLLPALWPGNSVVGVWVWSLPGRKW